MSEKTIQANRINSLLSTGPRTSHGKKIVSLNAMKFGLYSTKIFDRFKSNEEFQDLQLNLNNFYKPASPIEAILLNLIIEQTWRLTIINKIELGLLKHKELAETVSKSKAGITAELQRAGSSTDSFSHIISAYLSDKENEFFKANIKLTNHIENLINSQNELEEEHMKLADAFLNDAMNSQTLGQLMKFRNSTERSLLKLIDKFFDIRKIREPIEVSHISIMDDVNES